MEWIRCAYDAPPYHTLHFQIKASKNNVLQEKVAPKSHAHKWMDTRIYAHQKPNLELISDIKNVNNTHKLKWGCLLLLSFYLCSIYLFSISGLGIQWQVPKQEALRLR